MSKLHLFYGGPFSQWYDAEMFVDGELYNCAEQYMMASKAKLFGDEESLAKIMASQQPWEQKALGKKVKNFDKAKWEAVAKEIVFKANYAKFTQHEDLKAYILGTEDEVLVEASPTDTIWGIGLAETDPRAMDPAQWQGTNWLGEVIMDVRELIRDND
jgi:ribA/ribD-fused uncharacterized protein